MKFPCLNAPRLFTFAHFSAAILVLHPMQARRVVPHYTHGLEITRVPNNRIACTGATKFSKLGTKMVARRCHPWQCMLTASRDLSNVCISTKKLNICYSEKQFELVTANIIAFCDCSFDLRVNIISYHLFSFRKSVQDCNLFLLGTCLWRWTRQWAPKRRQLELRRRGITQKGIIYIYNTAKA